MERLHHAGELSEASSCIRRGDGADFDIPGIRLNFTSAAGCCFRDIHMTGIRLRKKLLIGEQCSGNGAGIRFNIKLRSIGAVKFHASGTSPD